MNPIFSDNAWEDYLHRQHTDPKLVERINSLINGIKRTPFKGIGKPETLKHTFSGYWSRCINDEHRLVYKVNADSIFIAQLRYHY